MDDQQQPVRLEDQLRRMILANGTAEPDAQTSPTTQPTVRLPPSGQMHAPQQFNSQQPTPQHGRNFRTSQNSFGNGHGPAPSMQPQHNGRHNGMQHQAQHGPHQGFRQSHPGFSNGPQPPFAGNGPQQRGRYNQQMPLDPNAFSRGNYGRPQMGYGPKPQQLFNPNQARAPPVNSQFDQHARQAQHLERLAASQIRAVEMSPSERHGKEGFCAALDRICREVCEADPERLPEISLQPFGSFKSGFATAGSDMDLVIVVREQSSTAACFSLLEDDLPRALEKRLLELGYGARLLTRTRVPIIKVCEKPSMSLLDKLREEREKWDFLPNELKYPHLHQQDDEADAEDDLPPAVNGIEVTRTPDMPASTQSMPNGNVHPHGEAVATKFQTTDGTDHLPEQNGASTTQQADSANRDTPQLRRDDSKPWTRERKAGPLDFPKTGVGIQSDINFFNPLGLHNTELLRCYSLCDARVQPMILFVKAWAKRRKINSSYSGTLSSYGYVLMVLHYLVNVTNPPVLPNLQADRTPFGNKLPSGEVVDGWNVWFWHDESQITAAARQGQLSNNREPLGSLLAGFFHYYSSLGGGVTFRWMQEVLSLRSTGGLLTKEEKGWVKAVTEEGEGKKIQHRYLFCIEDPFELNHNVARTVTHKGIVAIRDEFRRAKRILLAVGNGIIPVEGELFADLVENAEFPKAEDAPKTNGSQDSVANGTGHLPPTRIIHNRTANQHAQGINQRSHGINQQAHGMNQHIPIKPGWNQPPQPPQTKSIDVNDNDAFPTLGAAKPSKKKTQQSLLNNEDFSEISGDKAKAYLEEVKRKKDEAQAESTATGAAEAVLGDSD